MKEEPDSVVVPTRAIQTGQDSQYVYLVKEDKSVERRTVKVERALDGDSVVSAGLKGGETVVTDGQLRLTDGSKVVIKSAPAKSAKSGGEATASKSAATEDAEEDEPDAKTPATKSEGGRS